MKRYKWLLIQILLLPVLPMLCKSMKKSSDPNPVTAEERANAEIAANNWNHYVETLRPATLEYVADVRGDISGDIDAAQGMANADLQQKTAGLKFDPNRASADGRFSGMARSGSAVDLSVAAGATAMKAASLQGVLDAGTGKATAAQAGMSNLAGIAVKDQLAEDMAESNMRTNTASSVAGGMGAVASMYYKPKPAVT